MNENLIILTGATEGIGCALLPLLAGCRKVLAVGRNPERLNALQSIPNVIPYQADLADSQQVETLIQYVYTHWSSVSALFNNAAIQCDRNYVSSTADDTALPISFRYEFEVNLCAPIRLCEAILPLLLKSQGGSIVNVTSVLAVCPKQSTPIYSASKAALRSFTQVLRYQLRNESISVMEVIPPVTATGLARSVGPKVGDSADWVAEKIMQGWEARKPQISIGKARAGLFLFRWLPRILEKMLLPA